MKECDDKTSFFNDGQLRTLERMLEWVSEEILGIEAEIYAHDPKQRSKADFDDTSG
jgi:hypothetical protein